MRVLFLLCFIMFAGTVFAVEIEAEGEAVIVNDDTASAKTIALSRAKWAVIESVSPAKIKIDTIINNSELADEAVKTELSATIKYFTVINEKVKDDKYVVKIKANVIPEKAESIIDGLSSDTSICVMIAGELPGDNTLYFDQALSTAVIEQLNEKGFSVKLIDYSNINALKYKILGVKQEDYTLIEDTYIILLQLEDKYQLIPININNLKYFDYNIIDKILIHNPINTNKNFFLLFIINYNSFVNFFVFISVS